MSNYHLQQKMSGQIEAIASALPDLCDLLRADDAVTAEQYNALVACMPELQAAIRSMHPYGWALPMFRTVDGKVGTTKREQIDFEVLREKQFRQHLRNLGVAI